MKQWFARNRKRLAFVILVLGIGVIANELLSAAPKEAEIVYELPEQVDRFEVEFLLKEQLVRKSSFSGKKLQGGYLTQKVELEQGIYRLRIHSYYKGKKSRVARALEIPTKGQTHIRAFD